MALDAPPSRRVEGIQRHLHLVWNRQEYRLAVLLPAYQHLPVPTRLVPFDARPFQCRNIADRQRCESVKLSHRLRPEPLVWRSSERIAGRQNARFFQGSVGFGPSDSAMRFSLPYSRRRILAVRKTPCPRATAAADAHNASGIGKRPWWELRQRSKRR